MAGREGYYGRRPKSGEDVPLPRSVKLSNRARVARDGETGELLGVGRGGGVFSAAPADDDAAARKILAGIDENIGRAEERIRQRSRRTDDSGTASTDTSDWTIERDAPERTASAGSGGGWLQCVATCGRWRKGSECSTRYTDSITCGDTMTGDDSTFESVSISRSGDDEFWLAVSGMDGVRETQPLGGPKYYIVSITKMGKAKIVHEAMPVMGALEEAVEERGFEVIEYDLLAKDVKDKMEGRFMCGVCDFLSPDHPDDDSDGRVFPTGADDSDGRVFPTGAKEGTEADEEPADWRDSDVLWMSGQEDAVSVISDCTYGSGESVFSGLTMDGRPAWRRRVNPRSAFHVPPASRGARATTQVDGGWRVEPRISRHGFEGTLNV
ncbi:hypothetical protein ACHAW5_007474 [Stephanodiscus triporus]|uniref:Uncharacterized protein n=1 Tax=Stephanodiscus triporus TaxID=2934178 RepID=A0ABD3PN52_9STRA